MRFQLVRPVVSKGSFIPRFVKRIPSDIKDRMVGRTLVIPLGKGTVAFRVTASTQSIRFSLGTADPSQARIRQAEAVTYVEQYFSAVRPAARHGRERDAGTPVELRIGSLANACGFRSWAR
ncbi:hypothetical protein [Pararhizobium sp. A13]|uniref:DUF6538 domain-containing protein n=1 Tax=Pararhizobium sp. A13 TaxID=3133975 RepID=UPI00324F5FB4